VQSHNSQCNQQTSILCLFVCLQAKVVVFEENKDNTTLLDDTITQLHSNENYS
jgi:hypothetical protein